MNFNKTIVFLLLFLYSQIGFSQVRFTDDFESDLSGWQLTGAHAIQIIESDDDEHGKILEMIPDGVIYALIKDSDEWGAVRVEGDVCFPRNESNYLGLIYNATQENGRTDFGEIYLKGNGSYLRINPWRDGNVSRLLYEEYKTPIRGEDAVRIGYWQKFKLEVKEQMAHFYFVDMSTPKITFGLYESENGMLGVKPRVVGGAVWVDNIKVTSIENLSYTGPAIPELKYEPDSLITNWEYIGPLAKPDPQIEWLSEPGKKEVKTDEMTYNWLPFETDGRGAVITGRITEYSGSRAVAYFRTIIKSDSEKEVNLHFSTVDEIALRVNGTYEGFIYRDGYISLPKNDWNAWYDFWKNPEHEGTELSVLLKPGENQILLRVRNGQFASGGFFLHLNE